MPVKQKSKAVLYIYIAIIIILFGGIIGVVLYFTIPSSPSSGSGDGGGGDGGGGDGGGGAPYPPPWPTAGPGTYNPNKPCQYCSRGSEFKISTYKDPTCKTPDLTKKNPLGSVINNFSVSVDGYMQCANYEGVGKSGGSGWKLLTCDPSKHSATLQEYDYPFTCTGHTAGPGVTADVDTWAKLFGGECTGIKTNKDGWVPLSSAGGADLFVQIEPIGSRTPSATCPSKCSKYQWEGIPPDDLPSCVA